MGGDRGGVGRGVQRLLRRAGLAVTRHPAPGTTAHELRRLLQRVDVDLVIDVGGHLGEWVSELRRDVGYRGRVASFEPDPDSLTVLRARAGKDPSWDVLPYAVGDESRRAQLLRFSASNENSLLAPSDYGRERHASLRDGASHAEVAVVRLDDVIAELGPAQRIFLKMDTQGYEAHVLRGASALLARVVGLQVEMQPVPTYEEATPMPELTMLIRELGFAPLGFFPVTRDARRGTVATFDGLFARARDSS